MTTTIHGLCLFLCHNLAFKNWRHIFSAPKFAIPNFACPSIPPPDMWVYASPLVGAFQCGHGKANLPLGAVHALSNRPHGWGGHEVCGCVEGGSTSSGDATPFSTPTALT